MKVSILIRVNGNQPFLVHAVRSALNQVTKYDFDVWIILDRPGDEVLSVLKTFNDPKLREFWPTSIGFSAPITELIQHLQCDFIAILDSDDLMDSQRIQRQIDFLLDNPNVGAVGSSIVLIDSNGQEVSRRTFPTNSRDVHRNRFKKIPLAHPASMIRRSVLIEAGGYRSFYDFAEDYDLWLRILEISEITNLPDYLTCYRIHDNQTNSAKISSNVLAGVLARKSGCRRKRGASDYSDKYTSPRKLLRNPVILAEVVWRTQTRKYSQKAVKLRRDKDFLRFGLILLILMILNPKLIWVKFRSYK